MKRATEALTEPVSVAGAREPVRETVTVGVLDPTLRLKTSRTAMVDGPDPAGAARAHVHGRPVHLRNLAPNLVRAVQCRRSSRSACAAPAKALNRVGADDVSAFVDLAGLGAGEYSLPVHAESAR